MTLHTTGEDRMCSKGTKFHNSVVLMDMVVRFVVQP